MFVGYNFRIMLKKTVMATVSTLLAAVALSAQPNKDAGKKETPTSDKHPPVILATPSHQNNGEADTAKPKTDTPASHTPLKDPNWVLVIVGSITCIVIAWQSWETRKAAQAARGSIRLQERAMQQWVEATNWRSSMLQLIEGEGGTLLIDVDIVNETPYPVTITDGAIYFKNPTVGEKYGETVTLSSIFLPPHSPLEAHIGVEITDGQARQFAREPVVLTVFGAFSHTGILDKASPPQILAGTLACSDGMTRFVPKLNMKPIHPPKAEQRPTKAN
jgi:hypothetical protein